VVGKYDEVSAVVLPVYGDPPEAIGFNHYISVTSNEKKGCAYVRAYWRPAPKAAAEWRGTAGSPELYS
jgi:hypothetical protein